MFIPLYLFAQAGSKALYEQGLEAFKSKNYGSAELLFRKVVDEEDEYRDRAWYFMAISIFYQKKYDDAVFEFNRFLLVCSTAELANKSRFWIAESYYAKKDYLKAIEEYRRFISKNKKLYKSFTAESYSKIGDAYYSQGRFDEAIIEYKQSINYQESTNKKNEILFKIGNSYFLNKQFDESEKYLTQVLKYNDKYYKAKSNLLLGRIYLNKKNYNLSLRFFNQITNEFTEMPEFLNHYYYSAVCYSHRGDKKNAVLKVEEYIKKSGKSVLLYDSYYLLADLIKDTDQKRSVELYEKIYQNTNNSDLKKKSAIKIAIHYINNNELNKASEYLDELQINPENENSDILLSLGEIYLELEKFYEAEKIYKMLADKYKYDRNADQFQFYLAISYLKQGKNQLAKENFDKIKEINPFSDYLHEANYYIAVSDYESKNYKQSVANLNKYLNKRNLKHEFDARILLINSYSKLDNIAKVKSSTRLVINKYIRKKDISKELYNIRNYLKRKNQNVSYYDNNILKYFPDTLSAGFIYKEKADFAYKKNNYAYAEVYYKKYLQIAGNDFDTDTFLKIGEIIYKRKNYEQVIYYFENQKLTVNNIDVFYKIFLWMGKSYYQIGEYDEAYAKMKAIADYDFRSDDLYIFYKIYLKKNYIENAIALLPRLKSNNDIYSSAVIDAAKYYIDVEDYSSAIVQLNIIEKNKNYYEKLDEVLYLKSYISFEQNDFNNTINYLKKIKSGQFKIKADILLCRTLILSGRNSEAIALLNKNIYNFSSEPEGEDLLKIVIKNYSDEKNISKINYYSNFLIRNYKGNAYFVNYYKADYYYRVKNFKKAYYYYYKVSRSENIFQNDAYFHLGEISLYTYYRKKTAADFFEKIKNNKYENYFQSQLYLAQIYYEDGERDKSIAILKEIAENSLSARYMYKAKNLLEAYSVSN